MPAKGVLVAVTADVVIAGGGVIGTAIAWRAAAAGLDPGQRLAIVDTAANVAADANALAPLIAADHVSSITRTNIAGQAYAYMVRSPHAHADREHR